MIRKAELVTALGIVVALALLPMGLQGNSYAMKLLVVSIVWGGVALSWDLQLGHAGIFNLGQVGFFVCGAYTSAMLSLHLGLSPWLGLVAGALVGGAVAFAVGLPCLRLSGIYVALLTLAFFEMLGPVLTLGKPWGTGGRLGLMGIESFSWRGESFSHGNPVAWYYLALGLLAICLGVVAVVLSSRLGKGFIALRDSESLAQALGVDRFRTSLAVVTISGGLAGMMGSFYAHYSGALSPRILGLDLFIFLIIAILAGGAGRYPGAVVGAIVIAFVSDGLRPTGQYRLLIFGGLLVLLVLFLPGGLVGGLESTIRRIVRRRQRAHGKGAPSGAERRSS